MAELNLIGRDPFTDAYRESEQFEVEQGQRQFDLREAERKAKEAAQLDTALRRETMMGQQPPSMAPPVQAAQPALPPQGAQRPAGEIAPVQAPAQPQGQPLAPAAAPAPAQAPNYARAAAGVPGGGNLAMTLTREQDAAQDQQQASALAALLKYSKSNNPVDLQTYRMMAQKSGLDLPPGIEDDAQAAGNAAMGMLLAEKLYKTDEPKAHKFLQVWLQSGGDLAAAINTVGAPTGSRKSIQIMNAEGQRFHAMLNEMTGVITPATTADGQPVRAPSSAASAQKPDLLEIADELLAKGAAKTWAEAWEMANTGKVKPLDVYVRIYNNAYNNAIKEQYMEHDEAMALAEETATRIVEGITGQKLAIKPPEVAPPPPEEDPGWYDPRGWFDGDDQSQAAPTAPPAPVSQNPDVQPQSTQQTQQGMEQPTPPTEAQSQTPIKVADGPNGEVVYWYGGDTWYDAAGNPVGTQ